MIQVYSEWNTDYDHNGEATFDPINCSIDMELNGSWELTLEVPLDELGNFKLLVTNAVISAPTPVGDHQLFRIYETDKTEDSAIAYARPIFLDSARDVFLIDKRPTNLTGQEALDYLMDGTPYSGTSDIKLQMTAYYVRKNLIEALAGNEDNSFLSRWGGEIIYNNYNVDISVRQGEDRGLRVEFGRNIESIHETIDVDSMATRIVPVAFNGYTLDGDEPWVDSPRINDYPIVYTKEIEFSDIRLTEDVTEGSDIVGYDTLEELQAALVKQCEQLFEEGIDLPSITYEINMTDLARTDLYADFKDLESVALGDTIHCYHRILGIETEARVIELVYDCAGKAITKIVIGDYVEDYWTNLNNSVSMSATTVDFDSLSTKIAYIEANYITVNELYADIANLGFLTADEAEITYAKITDLDAALITVNELLAGYVKADELYADLAGFGFLTADSAIITDLVSQVATIQNAYVDFETVETLLANYATIADLSAIYASIDVLEAGYAKIEELEAAVANIDSLTASVANINYLLSGYTSTGDLTSIHITAENAVIDSEVVMNLVAEDAILGTLMAGIIYTDYVTIMSSDGNYINTGSMEQFLDENGTIRIQIGMDASGTYNFYIVGEDGELLWDALGLTEEGLTANGAIVKDAAVADDANISGYKLNIEEICSIINADATYTLDAASVTINGQGLDAWYVEINSAIEGLEGMTTDGLTGITRYYTYWDSDTEAPPDDENLTRAICGEAVCGLAVCGVTDGTLWQIEPIAAQEGLYRWCKLLGTYMDGHTEWGLPYCLDDGYERSQTQVLQTELNVVQGQIEAKVWEDDITAAVDPIYGDLTIISDQYASITVELGEISLQLGEMTTTIYEVQNVAQAASTAASEAQSTASAAQTAAETAQAAAEQAASTATDAQSTADKAAADAATAAQNATDAQAAADNAKAAADAAQEEYDALKEQADATDEELEEAQKRLEQALADAEDAQNAADQAAKDAADAAKLAEDAQSAADDAQKAAEAAQSTADQAVQDAADAKAAADAASDLAKAVEDQLGDISVTVETMETNITAITEEMGKITETVESVNQAIVTLGDDIADIEAQLAALDGLVNMTPWFCLWGSGTDEPPADEEITPATCGEATCGLTICGVTDGSFWQETEPAPVEGLYRWIKWYLEFENEESNRWSAAYCLDDSYTRQQISLISDQYATLTIEIDSIKQEVGNVQSIVTENYTYLSEQIASLEVTTESITGTVTNLEVEVTNVQNIAEAAQQAAEAADEAAQQAITDAAAAQAAVEEANEALKQAQADYDELKNRADATDEEIADAEARLKEAEEAVTAANEAAANAEELAKTAQAAAEAAQATADEASEKYDGLSATVVLIDEQVTTLVQDTEGIKASVSSLQGDITTINSNIASIEAQLDALDGLQEWIPYWCLWDSGTEAPPDDDELTPAVCGQATCGLTICGVTDGILWKEDEPPTQDALYEWVKYKLIYQNGDIEWWGPYCISDVYVRAQIDATWAQLNVLDDKITAQVAELHETIDGNYESLSLSISNVEQTAYQIQSTVELLEIELSESVSDLSSQITQTATDIRSEVTAVQDGLTQAIADFELGIQETQDGIVSFINASADVITLVGDRISISSDYFTLTEDGRITATSGKIAGWDIYGNGLTAQSASSGSLVVLSPEFISLGSTSVSLTSSGKVEQEGAKFLVTKDGTITATKGTIGGWTIGTSSLYDGTDSMSSTTAGLYLGTNGIRNYSTTGYVNITSGYIRNGSGTGTNYVQMNSGSVEMCYSSTLLGSYMCASWTDDTTKRGLNIALEYEADFIAFGRKSSSSAKNYASAYLINWGIDSSTLGYSEQHIFYGTARFTSSMYTSSVYPGSSNTTYYFTSFSNNGTLRGIYTNGGFSTNGPVLVGNTTYDGYGTYMLNINGDTYGSGSITSGSYVKVQNSYGACSLYANSSYYGMYDSNNGRWFIWRGSSGNNGFGNSGSPTLIYGDGVYLNGTSTAVTSDRSLKDDISPLSTRYDDLIEHLTPRAYTMKEGGDEKHIGFVVDEVEAAMKDAGLDPDDYGLTDYFTDESGEKIGAIRYEEIIPMLVHEIQTLRERINALEN